MAATDTSTLSVSSRPPEGSRATRRLRRRGFVPGIVYGAGKDPQPFEVDALTLRNTIAHGGTLLSLEIDGGKGVPVILKDTQRHPVRGDYLHVDFLRVRMDRTIQTTVALELTGGDDAPGVKEGGVLDQTTRELTVEAFPGDLPETLTHDVSALDINETVTLDALTPPPGVTFVDDPEMVIASITPPTAEPTEDEIEVETEVVGEAGAAADAQAGGATGDEAAQSASDSE